ncbi:MAG: type II toxin-antitoxin system PemK/MazF family toxin [Rhodospirillaceae bacterium]|nr:type II toxin-antitoxin system PemK/MazF family toxin [Rhodospirillaceae bacterium]
MRRGEIWWADLSEPYGFEPGYRRPVLIVQSDAFNRSRIGTVVALVLTTNLKLADAPGNIALTRRGTGLTRKSIVNVSQIVTLDRRRFTDRVGRVSDTVLEQIEAGMRLVLGLSR